MSALSLSQFDTAMMDKLDREASALETALYRNPANLLMTPAERRNLKEALDARYASMAAVLNRYAVPSEASEATQEQTKP